MYIRQLCLDMFKYIRTFVVSKLNNIINNLKFTTMATIYGIKMTECRDRKAMVELKLKCEHWHGLVLRSYTNKEEAINYARICNKTEKSKYGQLFYYTVEEITLY